VWAVLLGLMGGMIIGLPFRPAMDLGHGWHHHCHHGRQAAEYGEGCPWMRRHRAELTAPADGIVVTPPRDDARGFVVIPPSTTVRELHIAPGIGVRLELNAARDPFRATEPKAP
jgi:hypothetical protein